MAVLTRARRASRGFSLVELLVVLAIAGIITGGASLAIDGFRANDADLAIERLRGVLEAGAEHAAVRGRPLAVELLDDGYRFTQLDADGRWRVVENAPLFAPRTLPDPLGFGALHVHQRTPAERAQPAGQDARRLVFGSRAPHFELIVTGHGRELLRGLPNGQVIRVHDAEVSR
ncbi:MAG: prepilin-type N-terminal cleavage/methylation domain-containing protein [Azoarcus sp.]